MQITSLFWNTWLDNHIKSEERYHRLSGFLEDLLTEHQPDVIGLNEVVAYRDNPPKLLANLEKHGYHTEYTVNSPLDNNWKIGSILASRYKMTDLQVHEIGEDVLATHRGFPDNSIRQTFATIHASSEVKFTFGVVHLLALYPRAVAAHYRQAQPMADIMNKLARESQPVIIGGDFNEFRLLPGSVYSRVKSNYHRQTGTVVWPTWSALGYALSPVRANYDHIYWSRGNDHIELSDFTVIKRHPSDHAPLVGIFELN